MQDPEEAHGSLAVSWPAVCPGCPPSLCSSDPHSTTLRGLLNFSRPIWTSRQSDLDDFSPYILLWNFSKPRVNSKDVTVTANISTTWIPPLTSHWTCFSRHPAMVLRILTSLLKDISLWPLALCSSWFLPGAIPAGLGSLGLTYRTALNSKTLLLPLISPTEFFQKVYIVCNAINSL